MYSVCAFLSPLCSLTSASHLVVDLCEFFEGLLYSLAASWVCPIGNLGRRCKGKRDQRLYSSTYFPVNLPLAGHERMSLLVSWSPALYHCLSWVGLTPFSCPFKLVQLC